MGSSESIKDITAALAKAQINFKPIKRTEMVDYITTAGRKKYSYAPLSEIIDATKQALSDNGLAIMQTTKLVEGCTILETILSHSSGEWMSGELYVGKQDQPPQSEGSALTYKRRYGMSAILCVASEDDDDGETAMARDVKPDMPGVAVTPKITDAQTKAITTAIKEKGIPIEQAKEYMRATFGKDALKTFTEAEAGTFINAITSGKITRQEVQPAVVAEAIKLGAVEVKGKEGKQP